MTCKLRLSSVSTAPAWLAAVCLLCAAAAFVWHAAVTLPWLTAPGLNEYREWAQAEAMMRILSPDGPYSGPEGDGIYLYGFLYPLLGHLLWRLLGGDPVVTLRLLSYALTLLTCLTAGWLVWRRTRQLCFAAVAAALLLLVDWQNAPGTATPAPLGSLLALLALAACERRRYFLAALLAVAGFYVKPYFLIFILPVALHAPLSTAQWNLRSLRTGVYVVFIGIVSALLVRHCYPYYFLYNIVHHTAAASLSLPHLLRQLALCVLYFWPLFLGVALLLRRRPRAWRQDVFLLAALLCALAWLRLASHTGGFMAYAYHLLLPPLTIAAFSWGGRYRPNDLSDNVSRAESYKYKILSCDFFRADGLHLSWRHLAFLFAVIIFGIVFGNLHINLPHCPTIADAHHALVAEIFPDDVPPSSTLNLSPALARDAYERGIPSLDNGQHQYVSTLYSPSPLLQHLFPEMQSLRPKAEGFEAELLRLISTEDAPARIIIDDRSIITPADLSLAGYHLTSLPTLRIGVHTVSLYLGKRE